MKLLINKDTVALNIQTAIGYNDKEFEYFIREAQEFDFMPLVCEEFFNDLQKDTPEWRKLIEGGNYDFNGNQYEFSGIGRVISYFAYARFILKSNVVSTSHGFTIKKSPNSEPLSLEERRNFYYSYKADANKIFESTKKYIERNISLYQNWNCGSTCRTQTKGSFKTKVIQ